MDTHAVELYWSKYHNEVWSFILRVFMDTYVLDSNIDVHVGNDTIGHQVRINIWVTGLERRDNSSCLKDTKAQLQGFLNDMGMVQYSTMLANSDDYTSMPTMMSIFIPVTNKHAPADSLLALKLLCIKEYQPADTLQRFMIDKVKQVFIRLCKEYHAYSAIGETSSAVKIKYNAVFLNRPVEAMIESFVAQLKRDLDLKYFPDITVSYRPEPCKSYTVELVANLSRGVGQVFSPDDDLMLVKALEHITN